MPQALKESIIKLGASFIKLAQVLATRADFFDENYLKELKELHDEIPPMRHSELMEVYKKYDFESKFVNFQKIPIASASIGQVHIGYLKDGTKVAIKIRRKGIKDRIKADLRILRAFNTIFEPLFSRYTKHSLESLIIEFSGMISKEVDLSIELLNLDEFTKRYQKEGIVLPKPFKELSNSDVLVMSFIEGIRFDDKEALKKLKINPESIIEKLVLVYVEQMLIQGYFHADPHPGNLLITHDGKLAFLDFGMVKSITNHTRIAIIEIVKYANERDFEGFINAAKKLGVITEEASNEAMQAFSEKMFEIFNNANLSAANMQKLAFELLENLREMPFKLPQEAIYIIRVSSIIEGLGTTYIENFNGIKDILPILKKNMPRALGANDGIFDLILKEIKEIPFTAKRFSNVFKKLDEGPIEVRFSKSFFESYLDELKRALKEVILAIGIMLIALILALKSSEFFFLALILIVVAILRVVYRL